MLCPTYTISFTRGEFIFSKFISQSKKKKKIKKKRILDTEIFHNYFLTHHRRISKLGAHKDNFVPKILKWKFKVSFIPSSVDKACWSFSARN